MLAIADEVNSHCALGEFCVIYRDQINDNQDIACSYLEKQYKLNLLGNSRAAIEADNGVVIR